MLRLQSVTFVLLVAYGSMYSLATYAQHSGSGGFEGRGAPSPANVYPIVGPDGNYANYNQPITPITVPTGPNGATQTQVGTTTYYSPGGSSVTNGNQTIYSNGSNCVVNGNQKVCN